MTIQNQTGAPLTLGTQTCADQKVCEFDSQAQSILGERRSANPAVPDYSDHEFPGGSENGL